MSDVARSPSPPADSQAQFSPEHLRELFHRKTLANERHRAAVARMLEMDDTEAAALAQLAQHGQLTPGELGSVLGLSSGGTTALIHRLLEAGHLTRHPHPSDKRSSLLTAAPAVIARAEQLYAPLVAGMNELAARLSETDRAVVGRYLSKVVEMSEHQAQRMRDRARTEERELLSPPSPGLWS